MERPADNPTPYPSPHSAASDWAGGRIDGERRPGGPQPGRPHAGGTPSSSHAAPGRGGRSQLIETLLRNYHLLSPPLLGSRSPAFFRPLSLEPSAGRGLRAGAPFGLRFSAPEGPRGPHAARGCAGLPPPAARLAHHGAPKPAAPGGRREGASHQCPHARTHPERPRLIRDSRGITRARGATAYVPNSQPETDWRGSFPAPRAATSWSRFPRGPRGEAIRGGAGGGQRRARGRASGTRRGPGRLRGPSSIPWPDLAS